MEKPTHVEVFECVEPDFGMTYQVLDDEWDLEAEPPVRVIKQVRLIGVSAGR